MPDAKTLSHSVRIARHYQRSIRIDADLGRADALEGYVCHGTAHAALDTMVRQLTQSNQRAFTWTGPFGGGKSSLAVALASALSADREIRTRARIILGLDKDLAFDKAFPARRGWLTLPIVGKRSSVVSELAGALAKAKRGVDERKATGASVIADICAAAESKDFDGALVVIDEMGKFLEAAMLGSGDDVYFFQELAEAAARAPGKVVVVGILHQSFAQYSARLGIETRDDWAKVQGRFSDIPIVAASDEVVELISRAIKSEGAPRAMKATANAVAASIRARRPAVGPDFGARLLACWPLHPAMASLLGPISKRQFGQNERSTFGFLASVEPFGFRSYLAEAPAADAESYRPHDYWDYLRANLEPAILSSPDGHRWAQAAEAVERTEAKSTDSLLVQLIKSIAVIDLFRNGSGLAADAEVLHTLFARASTEQIAAALDQLEKWRVVIHKKHLSAWSVFEGSDFDIEAAIGKARASMHGVDFAMLSSLTDLYPVIAKRHYYERGTMRWMNMALCRLTDAERLASAFKPAKGEFGVFLLALPDRNATTAASKKHAAELSRTAPWPVVVGVPNNHARIDDLAAELLALQAVRERAELGGDPVARREVDARIADVRANLEEQLRAAVLFARWSAGDLDAGSRLSAFASVLADHVYEKSPALWSELVNRDGMSSNSVKARRELLHRMLASEQVEALGMAEGFPAERGLYETLLRSTGLHRESDEGVWGFQAPHKRHAKSFAAMWKGARDKFADSGARVAASDIHALWSQPPFGIRAGAIPVLFAAFVLAHKGNIAVYKDGVFVPHLADADIDEYLQDPKRFSLSWVLIDDEKARVLAGIAKILAEVGAPAPTRDPLEAARGLVGLVFGLPAWTQRTQSLSLEARQVRDTLLKAHDPHKVLFVDLPAILDTAGGERFVRALRGPVIEIAGAYGALMKKIEASMLKALDAPAHRLDRLNARAEALAGVTGDLRQDAFSGRLAKHDGLQASVEGILSLAANKPPRDWNDRDIDAAMLDIAKSALSFRQAEAFVSVRGRQPTSEAFAVVIGAGADTKTVAREFSIPDRHRKTVEEMASKLVADMEKQGHGIDVLLAVLAKAGMRLAAADAADTKEKTYG
ncbi:ATP-binding protein [Variovorax sp. RTB1]|uniref:ATP-binding protein n=1 Tax=Variovorax sp. RTB1 TaxID=3048631 RepID=UPI002B22366A|nr:ATP-binding protein [Variovorax sp. RTB1]MEB0114274.1 ATP-binding protein [Variovorax sp. RTB1]